MKFYLTIFFALLLGLQNLGFTRHPLIVLMNESETNRFQYNPDNKNEFQVIRFEAHDNNFHYVQPKVCTVTTETIIRGGTCISLSLARYFKLSRLQTFAKEIRGTYQATKFAGEYIAFAATLFGGAGASSILRKGMTKIGKTIMSETAMNYSCLVVEMALVDAIGNMVDNWVDEYIDTKTMHVCTDEVNIEKTGIVHVNDNLSIKTIADTYNSLFGREGNSFKELNVQYSFNKSTDCEDCYEIESENELRRPTNRMTEY